MSCLLRCHSAGRDSRSSHTVLSIQSSPLRLFASITFPTIDAVFGADTFKAVAFLHFVSFDDEMRRHLLFSATGSRLVGFFQNALFISQDDSIVLVLGLLAALNIVGVFILLRRFFSSAGPALLLSVSFAFWFSNLVIFSIPETYALSDLWVVIYLSVLLRVGTEHAWWKALGLSLLAALASLYNPPLLSLMLIHVILFYDRSKWGLWVRSGLANLSLGATAFLSANYALARQYRVFWSLSQFAIKWASIDNFLGWRGPAQVLVSFFLYSILSPTSYLPRALSLHDLYGYLRSPLGLALVPVVLVLLAVGTFIAVAKSAQYRRLAIALLAWILVIVLFYIYLDPQKAILFSSQVMPALLIILAIAFKSIKTKPWVKSGAVLLVSALVAVNNCLAFYAGPAK